MIGAQGIAESTATAGTTREGITTTIGEMIGETTGEILEGTKGEIAGGTTEERASEKIVGGRRGGR